MTGESFILTEEMLPCLPEKFRPVAKLIGLEEAGALIREFSGVAIYVGRRRECQDHEIIAETIGKEAFGKLINGYGRKIIHIPKIAGIRQRYRDILITQRFLDGETLVDLSIEYGLCLRQVYDITKQARENMPRRKPEPSSLDILLRNYQGESQKEFAQKHGISINQVKHLFRKHGISLSENLKQQRAERLEALVTEYQGEPTKTFARRMGISKWTARKVVEKSQESLQNVRGQQLVTHKGREKS